MTDPVPPSARPGQARIPNDGARPRRVTRPSAMRAGARRHRIPGPARHRVPVVPNTPVNSRRHAPNRTDRTTCGFCPWAVRRAIDVPRKDRGRLRVARPGPPDRCRCRIGPWTGLRPGTASHCPSGSWPAPRSTRRRGLNGRASQCARSRCAAEETLEAYKDVRWSRRARAQGCGASRPSVPARRSQGMKPPPRPASPRSTVAAHDQPYGSGPIRSSCHDMPFGAVPMLSTSASSVSAARTSSPQPVASASTSTGTRPGTSSQKMAP